jgi:hypothetical protein
MAKKAASSAATEASTEAPSVEKADPTLLGVHVPLNVTFTAAKTVAEAWKECFIGLRGAVQEKIAKKVPAAKSESAPASEQPVASA